MVWTKLSDSFADEMDGAGLDPEALTLHVAALCYCNRLLTDGKFPVRKAQTLYPLEDPDLAAKALVNAGLWELSADGQSYLIVNFLTDQRPAEKVLREREAGRLRQQNWLDRKRGHVKPTEETPANGKRSPARKATSPAKKATTTRPRTTKKRTNAVSNAVSNAYPAPPRPKVRGEGGGTSAVASPGGSAPYAPPPVKNPQPLEPAFQIDGVPFEVDLISQWWGEHGAVRTWTIIRLAERTHPLKWEAVAGALFHRLNTEIANDEHSRYVTTTRDSWSYLIPDKDENLESNGDVLQQWIRNYPALDGIRSEAFSVWTAAHAREQRGPQPKGNQS
jgi:hypothetical protein